MNTKGITAIPSAQNPRRELAQEIPKVSYIGCVASGRQTATIDRIVLVAACAEAEFCLKASVK